MTILDRLKILATYLLLTPLIIFALLFDVFILLPISVVKWIFTGEAIADTIGENGLLEGVLMIFEKLNLNI